MRKIKALLTLFLCAACIVPSIHADAVVINRPGSVDTDDDTDDREEDSHLTTDVEEVVSPGPPEIVTENIVEPADIIFAIDSTGSMDPYIQNVADNVEEFSRYLEEKTLTHLEGKEVKVKPRMAVVEYKDITYDGKDSTVIHKVDGSPWHKSTAELINTLQIVKSNVDGGGDDPETVFDALGYIVDGKTFDFGEGAHKFVIVLSDADFKEENSFGYTESTMAEKLKEAGINTSVITTAWNYNSYKNIVSNADNLFNINSKTFSNDLKTLADVIFQTIEKEINNEITTLKVTCKGDNTIKVGNSAELKAVILPETADKKNVVWSVADEEIASIKVSSDTLTCTVTGISEGTTKVKAKTEDGAFTGSYDITVIDKSSSDDDDDDPDPAIEISKEDIRVTPSKKTIAKKKSFTIKVALTDEFKEDKEEEEIDDIWESDVDSITFRSSKSSVASVNAKGKVTGKKKGKALIKTIITLADGSEFIYKTTVYVK